VLTLSPKGPREETGEEFRERAAKRVKEDTKHVKSLISMDGV
jgi:hypothetical protein